jgi:Arabinose-binding domain of AraC transcription regulator, N-term
MSVPLRERIFHPTYLRLLCLHVRHRGALLTETLAGTGMTWRQLLHEKRLIPFNAARTLILSAKRLTACPSLGLEFGHSIDMAAHGVAGTAVAASRDVSRALEAAIRYRHCEAGPRSSDWYRAGIFWRFLCTNRSILGKFERSCSKPRPRCSTGS